MPLYCLFHAYCSSRHTASSSALSCSTRPMRRTGRVVVGRRGQLPLSVCCRCCADVSNCCYRGLLCPMWCLRRLAAVQRGPCHERSVSQLGGAVGRPQPPRSRGARARARGSAARPAADLLPPLRAPLAALGMRHEHMHEERARERRSHTHTHTHTHTHIHTHTRARAHTTELTRLTSTGMRFHRKRASSLLAGAAQAQHQSKQRS
jgi:hypothetical protein